MSRKIQIVHGLITLCLALMLGWTQGPGLVKSYWPTKEMETEQYYEMVRLYGHIASLSYQVEQLDKLMDAGLTLSAPVERVLAMSRRDLVQSYKRAAKQYNEEIRRPLNRRFFTRPQEISSNLLSARHIASPLSVPVPPHPPGWEQ